MLQKFKDSKVKKFKAIFNHRWQSRAECVPALGTQFSALAAEVGSCLIWNIPWSSWPWAAPAQFPLWARALLQGLAMCFSEGPHKSQGTLHSPLSKSSCLLLMGNNVMGSEDTNTFITAQIWGILFWFWVGFSCLLFWFYVFWVFFVENIWTC